MLQVLCSPANEVSAQEDPGWPQVLSNDRGKMTVHQPQVDIWENYLRLEARVAVVVTPTGWDQPVLGALTITAETQTDHESRTVLVYNKEVVAARYPALDSTNSSEITYLVESLMTQTPQLYSLDRILANVEQAQVEVRSTEVAMDPPQIFASTSPAVLVMFDGSPIFGPVENTELRFAVNTNWDVMLDPGDSTYYLLHDSTWLRASDYQGPYIIANSLPSEFSKIPDTDNWVHLKEHGSGDGLTSDKVPVVLVATKPSELIVCDGDPYLDKIEGTTIWWVSNTDSDLFLYGQDHNYYFLVSGRWFRAGTLDGPWSSVVNDLPEGFASIPEDHPRSNVLVSIPSTVQANEAVLQAQIPQQATVDRDSVSIDVAYQGEPEFEPIETTELYYATNTPYTVILSGSSYYCCHDGVWFIAGSSHGPWVVCDHIPTSIYSIPPSCPAHHVTYVYVYNTSPNVVVFGYTSGYYGMYVSNGCVVYGTGYYYPPYVYWGPYYPIYYPYHYTFGTAAYYNPYRGTYVRGAAVYGPYGGYGRGAAYNPHTGTYARGASSWGPYGGNTVAAAHNPYTGGRAATRQSHNSYSHWGESVVSRGDKWAHTGHYTDSRGTIAGYETSEGGRGLAVAGDRGRGVITKGPDQDLYVGKDGGVYKRGERGWSHYDDGDWNSVKNPNRERQAPGDRAYAARGKADQERLGEVKDRTSQSQRELSQDQKKKTRQRSGEGQKKRDRSSISSSDKFRDLERNAKARERGNKRVKENKSRQSKGSSTRATPRGRGRRR
jgi:hypothetical protein